MDLNWYTSLDWYKKTNKVRKILFVCSANTCRSPAAEYYFKKMTHWWSGVNATSRGTKVNKILAALEAQGIKLKSLLVELEVKKVIGDKTSKFLKKHTARQISAEDTVEADLILTMETSMRDSLRKEFPDEAYKIFTLKGFVEQTDNRRGTSLNIGNPFLPPSIRRKSNITVGKVRYLNYIKNYMQIVELIEHYVRKLIEIIYLLNGKKK